MYNDIRIFCENIKKIRKNKRLNKKEMANLLGISVYSLNVIEGGKLPYRLSVEIIGSIINVGVNPKSLQKNNVKK